jgi:regulator of replication initiation timing
MENEQRLELKIQALKEGFRDRVAKILDEYEDKVAELRLEITEQASHVNSLSEHNQVLQQEINRLSENVNLSQVIEGEVVQEDPAEDSTEDTN